MPEEIVSGDAAVAEAVVEAPEAPPAARFESPPVAGAPERREFDPRARLHELALELVRTQNRRLLVEYLRLRRAR
jgi:hypothetical protein